MKIRINGNNTRAQRTENIAIRHRINQELRFLYIKKQKLILYQVGINKGTKNLCFRTHVV